MIQIKDRHGKVLPWEINRFPDGQLQFKMLKADAIHSQEIKASITSSVELDIFLQAVHMLKNISKTANPLQVVINYFYGARSDKNEAGDYYVSNTAAYFEDLIRGVQNVIYVPDGIGKMHPNYWPFISVLAPHCQFKCDADLHGDFECPRKLDELLTNADLVIFPDESAQRRFPWIKKESVTCKKVRDQVTGDIVDHSIPKDAVGAKNVLVLDDLCDAGRTFIDVALTLDRDSKTDKHLFIYHGVFSNNALSRLLEFYSTITVTNSLPQPEQQFNRLSDELQKRVNIINVW